MHTHPEKGRLTAIRRTLAGLGIDAAALRLAVAIKNNPNWRDQPRKPAGSPDGGQWTANLVAVPLWAASRLIRNQRETLKRAAQLFRIVKDKLPGRWKKDDTHPAESEFDEETKRIAEPSKRRSQVPYTRYRSNSEAIRNLGPAGPGKQWHHIVEQRLAKNGRFPPEWIYNTDNMIALLDDVHQCVSDAMSTKREGELYVLRKIVEQLPYGDQYNFNLELIVTCMESLGYDSSSIR